LRLLWRKRYFLAGRLDSGLTLFYRTILFCSAYCLNYSISKKQ
jgi:hypothetical protein